MVAGIGAASAVPIGAVGAGHLSHIATDAHAGDTFEAWYSTPSGSLCLPFLGCLPVPAPLPSTFPAGTLHVGETLGAESARSYVVPAIPKPTARVVVSGGSLLLPVDASPTAGTLDLGSARIKVCLTTGKLPASPATQGATPGTPPSIDCKVHSAARFSREHSQYLVDLAPFIKRWTNGTPNRGIALVPDVAAGSGLANWHVAIDGRGASGATIHSLLAYRAISANPPTSPTPNPGTSSPPDGYAGPTAIDLPIDPGYLSPSAAPPQLAPSQSAAFYYVRAKGFRYPAIFVAPLGILAGLIFFGRLFTGSTTRPRPVPVGLGRRNVPPTDGS